MDKRTKRNLSPIIADRDAQLAAEANEWARHRVRQYFEEHKTGYYLGSDILTALDEDPAAPPSWYRWLSDYPTRYAMVRNALVALERKSYLDTRSEYNALGRESTAYQRAHDLDDWDVKVMPGDQAESVTSLVIGWLRTNPKAVKYVKAITITRSKMQDHHEVAQAGSGRPGPQSVQRKRSR